MINVVRPHSRELSSIVRRSQDTTWNGSGQEQAELGNPCSVSTVSVGEDEKSSGDYSDVGYTAASVTRHHTLNCI